jgi:HEAT repeat protein
MTSSRVARAIALVVLSIGVVGCSQTAKPPAAGGAPQGAAAPAPVAATPAPAPETTPAPDPASTPEPAKAAPVKPAPDTTTTAPSTPAPTATSAAPAAPAVVDEDADGWADAKKKAAIDELTSAIEAGDIARIRKAIDAIASVGPVARSAITELTAATWHDDPVVRWHAVRAIGLVGEGVAEVVPTLVGLLRDPDAIVVSQAAHAIELVRGDDRGAAIAPDAAAAYAAAIEPLIESTLHADARVRRAAIFALRAVSTPDKLLPLVSRHLADADPSVVLPALHTLAEMGADSLPFLLKALAQPGSRYWATVALAEMGPAAAPAVPQLIELARDAEIDERLQAIYALAGIGEAATEAGPVLAEALDGSEPLVRLAAAHAIGRIKAGGCEEALARADADANPLLAEIAAWARARLHPDDEAFVATALTRLEAGLAAADPALRAASVTGLSDLAPSLDDAGKQGVATALVGVLGDPDDAVSLRAGAALVQLGGAAIDAIKGTLSNEALRPRSLEVLAAIGAPAAAALSELEAALADPEPVIRGEAAFALGSIGGAAEPLVPKLKALLDEEEPAEVRFTAAYALGRIGPPASPAFERLVGLTKSADELMATVAVWAALKIKPGDSSLFADAVPLLERALASERELARLEAAVSLGEMGAAATEAVPELEFVAANDPVESVRDAATHSLALIRGR